MKNVNGLYRYVRFNKTLDYFLSVICDPSTWMSLDEPHAEGDILLDELVKKYHEGELELKSLAHSVSFYKDHWFEVLIWTGNYPYSYGQAYKYEKSRLNRGVLPTRYARVLFKRFLDKEGRPIIENSSPIDVNEIIKNTKNLKRNS